MAQWLENYPKVQKWAKQYPLEKLVDEGGGLVKIPDFFPLPVAEYLHQTLLKIPEEAWVDTLSERNYSENNIAHRFYSVKDHAHPVVQNAARALGLLAPIHFNTFSAAKYLNTHHIETHDDRAFASVKMDDGSVLGCWRDVAIIVYLSKDWTEAEGGLLQDFERNEDHVPTFNTAIAFRVPRLHAVTPVLGSRPRLSLFGWFLRPADPDAARALGFPPITRALHVAKEKAAASGSGAGDGEQVMAESAGENPTARSEKEKKKTKKRDAEGGEENQAHVEIKPEKKKDGDQKRSRAAPAPVVEDTLRAPRAGPTARERLFVRIVSRVAMTRMRRRGQISLGQ
eukprot:m.47289 g.47289  ORF g.47289 m.47289 type:complete len:341 (+) comp11249_c0_seq1:48-1070(+)